MAIRKQEKMINYDVTQPFISPRKRLIKVIEIGRAEAAKLTCEARIKIFNLA
jgi:hypothetical protein